QPGHRLLIDRQVDAGIFVSCHPDQIKGGRGNGEGGSQAVAIRSSETICRVAVAIVSGRRFPAPVPHVVRNKAKTPGKSRILSSQGLGYDDAALKYTFSACRRVRARAGSGGIERQPRSRQDRRLAST